MLMCSVAGGVFEGGLGQLHLLRINTKYLISFYMRNQIFFQMFVFVLFYNFWVLGVGSGLRVQCKYAKVDSISNR